MNLRPATCAAWAALAFGSPACIDGIPPPELLPQGEVTYGNRVYLVDPTTGDQVCTRLTELLDDSAIAVAGGGRPRADTMLDLDGVYAALPPTDGIGDLTNEEQRVPQNCFVPMAPGEPKRLRVDRLETPNILYQLCKDSEHCIEPDPSEADRNDICRAEDDGFFDCPVVSVGRQDAEEFCSFLGRRLPTAMEAIIIRQQAWAAEAGSQLRRPEAYRRFPGPTPAAGADFLSCPEAHLANGDCGRPRRLRFDGTVEGAAEQDVVETITSTGSLFDLTGHVAEWVVDGIRADQDSRSLPWFCLGPVDQGAGGVPICPEPPPGMDLDGNPLGRLPCVFGYYDPNDVDAGSLGLDEPVTDELGYGLYPVCVTSPTGRFSGSGGALFGGGWRDGSLRPAETFGIRFETNLDELDSMRAEAYGIRCVDDRDADNSLRAGDLPLFEDFDPTNP
jgi:hypothetical protein